MSDVNVVVVSGTMGKQNARAVSFGEDAPPRDMVSFGVMSIDRYENKEKKTLVRCVAWGEQLAREIKLLSEGDVVIVQGKLSNRKGKDDQWVTEVTVSRVTLAGEPKHQDALPF